MKFEIERESIQDMIAMFGPEHAVNELIASFLSVVETELVAIYEEKNNG